MDHVAFGVFRTLQAAEAAVEELLDSDLCLDRHVNVVVHRSVDPERLDAMVQSDSDLAETDGAPATVKGALIGGLAGAVLLGPLDLIGVGPLVGSLFGAWAGAAQGALAGGLVGLGLTDGALRRLGTRVQRGDTLVTVTADSREHELEVEALLTRHGADVIEKHVL